MAAARRKNNPCHRCCAVVIWAGDCGVCGVYHVDDRHTTDRRRPGTDALPKGAQDVYWRGRG